MNMNFEDVQKTAKDNMDASVKAYGVLAKNMQALTTEAAEYTKKAYEANTSHMEKLFGVKTLDKAIELNTEFMKSSYEGFVSFASKFGNAYTDMAKEAMKPVETAFNKVKTAAAK
jgi:hypothetical protein